MIYFQHKKGVRKRERAKQRVVRSISVGASHSPGVGATISFMLTMPDDAKAPYGEYVHVTLDFDTALDLEGNLSRMINSARKMTDDYRKDPNTEEKKQERHRYVQAILDGHDEGVIIAFDPGDGGQVMTLKQLRDANAEDEYFQTDVARAIRKLKAGETYEGNEGAGGTWKATRLE